MEFHSVEMSASGRQCHLWVWRVVCPTTETEYYISLHTHCVTHPCMSTLHTHVWVLPHRRRILFEGRQCSAAMVRRRLLCHGEGWVLTIYLCLLYFRISIFLSFVFFALGLGSDNWIDSCLAIARECSSLAVFSYLHFVSFLYFIFWHLLFILMCCTTQECPDSCAMG